MGRLHFKRRNFKESQPLRRIQRVRENPPIRDYSDFECFNCSKIGHIAQNCPIKKQEYKKRIKNNKRYHAHIVEDEEEEEEEEEEGPPRKQAREEDAKEYVLFSALSGSITPGEDTWLIDSGASKYMMGQKKIFKRRNFKESQPPRRIQKVREIPPIKDYFDFECFHCNKIGHIA